MTQEQALEILKQVCAKMMGTLADHNTAQQALQVVVEAVKGEKKDG